MNSKDEIDDPRREFLIKALAAGFFAMGGAGLIQPVWAMGKIPKVLVPGKSIYDMRGTVLVNGKKADYETFIKSSDLVETRSSSHVVFAVGKDAFVLRSNGKLQLSGTELLVDTLRIVTGKLLSVFGKKRHRMHTANATIGIRGTGLYVESEPDRSYVCTCYGVVNISATRDPSHNVEVHSQHHDAPKYILSEAHKGQKIVAAPFINHTDTELQIIEELVGRTPPFAAAGAGYSAPRRNY